MKKIKLTAILFILVILSIYPIEVGDEAQNFVNLDLNENYIFSKNIIGNGWVILDFFATYCEGCKIEIPELEDLLLEFKSEDLQIIVFATDQDGISIIKPYFTMNPTTLTILLDPYSVTVQNYNVEEIPSIFLVNPEGIVVFKSVGYKEEIVEEIKDILINAFN